MKKENLLKIIMIIVYLIVIFRVSFIIIIKRNYYKNLYNERMNKIIYSTSAPRGRILDKKGKVLVDNQGVKSIVYTKISDITKSEELEIASTLSKIIDLKENISMNDLKEFYIMTNKDKLDKIIDSNIKEKYLKRIISEEEYKEYLYYLITDQELEKIDRKTATIYNYMNKGYIYQSKVIKTDITDEELTLVNESNLPGIRIEVIWKRVYNYDTCLNQIFGTIGNITLEDKDKFLNDGYSLDDIVGVSFLEKKYESTLKGEKTSYKVNKDNTLSLVHEGNRGSDIILGIDIELQLNIEKIVKKEIKNAKKYPSSKYYTGSYIVITDPNNGEIISMIAYKYDGSNFKSDVIGLLTNSYTVGSVVKGASQSVAYKYGVLNEKTRVVDSCVKLKNQLPKCSWTRLGSLNDINALALSSNYFQFLNAIKVSGYKYKYNMSFNPTIDDFNKYREVFKSYGLGAKTGIDLDEESVGITGSKVTGDLLLNLSIGQYDTYTPLMLNQYISTIANKKGRYSLRLVTSMISKDGSRVEINPPKLLNEEPIDEKYLNRVLMGLRKVSTSGTGAGYVSQKYKPSGKTGTSETFYNGKSTTTKSFIMFAPSDNPKYAMIIISPNISYKNSINNYKYPINSRLSRQITNILFEK